jgi:hypothetical protein
VLALTSYNNLKWWLKPQMKNDDLDLVRLVLETEQNSGLQEHQQNHRQWRPLAW